MLVYGCYFNEENKEYELVLIGSKNEIINIEDYLVYEASSLNFDTLDYDNDAVIIRFNSSITVSFKNNIEILDTFKMRMLTKEMKKVKYKSGKNEITLKIK